MQGELKRLQHETGITFVFVTHDQEEALTMSDRIAVMNEGRILQVGSPRDIYDRPANRFVAGFIGDTNILAAELVPNGHPRPRLRIGGVAVPADLAQGFGDRPPGPVPVAIRPECLKLEAAGAAGALQGTLTDTVYFGTDTHFHVTLDSGEALVARVQNARTAELAFRRGERIGVRAQADAFQVLAE
jgi:spermidine/putrescine transport system ATP-binding protein